MQINEKIKSNIHNSNYNSQQYLSTFASPLTMPKKLNQSKIKEKQLNLHDFINQKNKFKMEKFFDQKATKKFLENKSKALMELNLSDVSEELYNKEFKSFSAKNKNLKNKKTKMRSKFKAKNTFTPEKRIRPNQTEKNLKIMSDINSIKANKDNAKRINRFIFSKSTRDLMINDDDIEVSSISKDSKPRRNETKKDGNLHNNNNDKKELDINKCNESLFSMISEIL